jgi:hypothetical protein
MSGAFPGAPTTVAAAERNHFLTRISHSRPELAPRSLFPCVRHARAHTLRDPRGQLCNEHLEPDGGCARQSKPRKDGRLHLRRRDKT